MKPKLPAAPEPGVHPLSVSGRALDPDGEPIEGATIFIVSTNGIGFNPLPAGYRAANSDHQANGVELELPAESTVTVEFDLVRDVANEK